MPKRPHKIDKTKILIKHGNFKYCRMLSSAFDLHLAINGLKNIFLVFLRLFTVLINALT